MRRSQRTRQFAVGLAAIALVAAGCGGDTTNDPAGGNGDVPSGTVPIAGSSTVEPISTLVAEDFGGDAAIEITGTSTGFGEHFCEGLTVINNASRPIKDTEVQQCADNGVTNILELKVAIDGMTVVTSNDNDLGITCLSLSEIYALLGPESGPNGAFPAVNWGDADALADEIGDRANDSFAGADAPIAFSGPGTESGTYDSFFELAIEDIAEAREVDTSEKASFFRDDWQGNNLDTATQTAITGNQYSIGWFGFAFFVGIQDQLTAFDIMDEDGNCITPTPDTIASGAYPLARDLYIYVDLDRLDDPEYGAATVAYIDYYLSDAGFDLVAEAGYVNLDEAAWAETNAAWDARAANV